jgi:N6-L-threonylcarbamoyladenine synthase
MTILAIETSCDETAMALMEATGSITAPKFNLLKNLVSSQIKVHAPFGGVVPNLAKREHIKNLPILYGRIFGKGQSASGKSKHILNSKSYSPNIPIDAIAVTVGPGLEPALWAGIIFAKNLAKTLRVPLIGANHLEGHLYSFLLLRKGSEQQLVSSKGIFPAISLIVSGGHTVLLLVKNLKEWKVLGETRDDAAGEAFDKVARLLSLPYPGGPEISKLAKKGRPDAIKFPRPMIYDKNYDFSFSGLKTAVLYYLREHDSPIRADQNADKRGKDPIRENPRKHPQESADAADIAASFQQAVIDVLSAKTMRAAKEFKARSVMLSGGVAANTLLRSVLKYEAKRTGINFFVAPKKFNTDNAAMIAVAGYMAHLRRKKYSMRANGNLKI